MLPPSVGLDSVLGQRIGSNQRKTICNMEVTAAFRSTGQTAKISQSSNSFLFHFISQRFEGTKNVKEIHILNYHIPTIPHTDKISNFPRSD